MVIIIELLFLVTRNIIYIVSQHSMSFGTFGIEICTILYAAVILMYGEIKYRIKEGIASK